MIAYALDGLGQLESVGVEDGEVVEAGVPRWRGRTPLAFPGVQGDVVMVAASRQPDSLDTDLLGAVENDVEAQDVAVKVCGSLEVSDFQMHVADTDLRMEGRLSHNILPFSASWRTVSACIVRYSPNLVEGEFSEVGGLSLLSDYGDRAMGVADNSIRDTAHQSPP
jgi:hypothetical protein